MLQNVKNLGACPTTAPIEPRKLVKFFSLTKLELRLIFGKSGLCQLCLFSSPTSFQTLFRGFTGPKPNSAP